MSDYVSREDHEDRVAQINAHRMDLQDRIEALNAEISKWHTVTRAHLDRIEAQAAEIAWLREAGAKLNNHACHDDDCQIVTHGVWSDPIPCTCGYEDAWKLWSAALGGNDPELPDSSKKENSHDYRCRS